MTYKISLVARNEGVEYVDENGVYRFNVSLENGVWTVYLPGTFGDFHEIKVLSDEDRNRIIPRVVECLSKVRWLGFFSKSYSVQVVEQAT